MLLLFVDASKIGRTENKTVVSYFFRKIFWGDIL